jgi:DNA-binding MurR/RpiR family transcriptional regulator
MEREMTAAPSLPPATFDDLVDVLRARQDRLTPSQRLLAARVMSDPETVAFMTVSELASVIGVNESTVVRFATGLGLDGYPALTRLCRDRLREEAQLLRRFGSLTRLADEDKQPLDPASGFDPLEQATAYDQANIARTLARIDRDAWTQAVAALADSPRVHLLGLRKCHAPAYLLGYLLRMIRDDVEVIGTGAGTLVEEVRRIRPDDCFVAMSIHRYSRATVRAFERAAAAGATTIALTDNPASPLVRVDGITFYVETTGVAVMRSLAGFVSLVQALANDVAVARGADTRAALVAEEDLLDTFDVYTAAP